VADVQLRFPAFLTAFKEFHIRANAFRLPTGQLDLFAIAIVFADSMIINISKIIPYQNHVDAGQFVKIL
jgi:hypothetical protein